MASLSLHELALENDLDQLTTLSAWVEQLSGQIGLSAQCAFRLDLVLTEAVTNIIEHAYVDEHTHTITVTLRFEDKKVGIQITDDGLPFNPLEQPQVVLPKSLEEATEGGLGVHLIRSYTHHCDYQRARHQNQLTLTILDCD